MANGTLAASQIEMLSQDGTGTVTITPPATNTNRAITLPDAAGQVVLNSATQTLTNKTIQGGAITSATAVTASGTAVDFTSIPSWVKRITVMFSGVSTNSTSPIQVQVGAGSIQTTSYASSVGYSASAGQFLTSTSAFICTSAAGATAAGTLQGSMIITTLGDNLWCEQCGFYSTGNTIQQNGGGSVSLGGTLDRIRITTVAGTPTFDAGTINILYEG